jgi:hypothetical protein
VLRAGTGAVGIEQETVSPGLGIPEAGEAAAADTQLIGGGRCAGEAGAPHGAVGNGRGANTQDVVLVAASSLGGTQLPQLVEHHQHGTADAGLQSQLLALSLGNSLGDQHRVVDAAEHQDHGHGGNHQLDQGKPPP